MSVSCETAISKQHGKITAWSHPGYLRTGQLSCDSILVSWVPAISLVCMEEKGQFTALMEDQLWWFEWEVSTTWILGFQEIEPCGRTMSPWVGFESVYSLTPLPVHRLCLLCVNKRLGKAVSCSGSLLPTPLWTLPLKWEGKNKILFYNWLLSVVFYHSLGKGTNTEWNHSEL